MRCYGPHGESFDPFAGGYSLKRRRNPSARGLVDVPIQPRTPHRILRRPKPFGETAMGLQVSEGARVWVLTAPPKTFHNSRKRNTMDALTFLRADHQSVLGMLEVLDGAPEGSGAQESGL